jgi:NADH-quinone oxidoreductase subunit C
MLLSYSKKNNLNFVNKVLYYKFIFEIFHNIPSVLYKIIIKRDEIVFYTTIEKLLTFLFYCKYNTNVQQKLLIDIIVVDYINKIYNFLFIYTFLSVLYNFRLFIKFFLNNSLNIFSVFHIFPAATWFEREIWDMFGIFFINSIDMRRILTDYGFKGHPLLKSFPISGFYEVRFEQTLRKVVKEPVELAQEFRNYHTVSSWAFYSKNNFENKIEFIV